MLNAEPFHFMRCMYCSYFEELYFIECASSWRIGHKYAVKINVRERITVQYAIECLTPESCFPQLVAGLADVVAGMQCVLTRCS